MLRLSTSHEILSTAAQKINTAPRLALSIHHISPSSDEIGQLLYYAIKFRLGLVSLANAHETNVGQGGMMAWKKRGK
jgi:hypothetical protein